MEPTPEEIDQISDAFIAISEFPYNDEQIDFINAFLQRYAREFDSATCEDLFVDDESSIQLKNALQTMNQKRQYISK